MAPSGADDDAETADRKTGTVADSVSCAPEQALSLTQGGPSSPGDDLPRSPSFGVTVPPAARYADEGEVGRGGMGAVRRIFDRVLMRSVAMKLIEPVVSRTDSGIRFVEEAQITGQLDHPNIVPVYEFGTAATGQLYFTMKLVSGQTLHELIAGLHGPDATSSRALWDEALERILRLLLRVCEAVAFAHSRGVIHRDLKPANIMIGTHGQVYVMDWGLGLLLAGRRSTAPGPAPEASEGSIRTSGRSSRATGVEGTPAYMAPEQALGQTDAIDARTDVFALGALLYQVLTGRPPFHASTTTEALALAANATIVPPQDVAAQPLPPGLCDIAMRAMRRDPADRYQTAGELHGALEAFLRGGGWFGTRRFEPGEVIVREGDLADAAYVIVSGRCEAYRERDGERRRLRELGPGDVFGEAALLNAEPRTASVCALDAVTVKVVTADAFERELGRSPWVGALVKQLAARFLELERRDG
jgi:eukaryotic-like serine/threonine-protein kinase